MTVKHLYLTQTNDPQELNQVFLQIGQSISEIKEAEDDSAKSGIFYMYDWEQTYKEKL
jgi:hypothetical protein